MVTMSAPAIERDDGLSCQRRLFRVATFVTDDQDTVADPRTGEGVTKPGDFTVDEKSHQVFLTEQGHESLAPRDGSEQPMTGRCERRP